MKLKCPQCGKEVPRPAIILVKQISCSSCGLLIPLDGRKAPSSLTGTQKEIVRPASAVVSPPIVQASTKAPTPRVGVCRKCRTYNPGETRNCSKCGTSLYEVCLICKSENRVGTQSCGGCKADLSKVRQLETIPKLRSQRQYVGVLGVLEAIGQVGGLPGELDTARPEAVQAIAEAEIAASQGDEAFASGKFPSAISAYEQAMQACVDYRPAIVGLAKAKGSIRRPKSLRVTAVAAACLIVLGTAVVFGIPAFRRFQDERAWRNTTRRALSAGENYERAADFYRAYLTASPQGRHSEGARREVQIALPQKIEERDWKRAEDQIGLAGEQHEKVIFICKEFMSNHPFNKYNAEAKRILEERLDRINQREWNLLEKSVRDLGGDYRQVLSLLDDYIRKQQSTVYESKAKNFKNEFMTLSYARAIEDGSSKERDKNWGAAAEAYAKAMELRPDAREARDGHERVNATARPEQFEAAMQEGQQAEANRTLEEALAAFEKALSVSPQAREAKDAHARVKRQMLAARIADLESIGVNLSPGGVFSIVECLDFGRDQTGDELSK